jgi:hypothetical protein
MTKRMNIRFHNLYAEGTLECVGLGTYPCLGKPAMRYVKDVTIDPSQPGAKSHPYYSRSYSCPPNDNAAGQCIMNYAILIMWRQGVYIHEWPTPPTYVGNGNSGTHGCIHLKVGDAETVYNWVDTKTRVQIFTPW